MQSFPLHLILYVVLTVINQGIALRTRFVPSMSMSTKPITIYGSQGSRSPLINWYCHELDLPFQMEPPNATPHPFGQIPCVQDGNSVLFESGAILMYLADKYGELSTPEQRGMVGSWIVWANASLDPVLFKENEKGVDILYLLYAYYLSFFHGVLSFAFMCVIPRSGHWHRLWGRK